MCSVAVFVDGDLVSDGLAVCGFQNPEAGNRN